MLLLRWLLNTIILLIVGLIVPGVKFENFWSALITALVLGFLNALIRPLIILLTLPVNILTLGLFTLIINAFLFWLASTIVKGFEVSNFWAAFFGALVYSIIIMIINSLDKRS